MVGGRKTSWLAHQPAIETSNRKPIRSGKWSAAVKRALVRPLSRLFDNPKDEVRFTYLTGCYHVGQRETNPYLGSRCAVP